MHKPEIIRSLALLTLGLVLAACDSSDDDTVAQPQTISWQTCESNSALQCATLQVPMVHSDIDSEKISIALNRIPATATNPMGSLLFNPGGPGGSGLSLIEELADLESMPEAIKANYHLVGFDPRGVGASTPIDCKEFGIEDLEDYPRTRADTEKLVAGIQALADACFEKYGSYLQHTGSRAVVRDIELIRIALAEPTLNFIGYSYGTRLAALYAQDYPTTTGRIILDGSLPPTHSVPALFGGALPVMESNINTLMATCQQFAECNPDDYKNKLENRVQTLIDNDTELELELLGTLLIAAAVEPEVTAYLAEPLFEYSKNWNATGLLELAESLSDEDEDEEENENSATMLFAVVCADDAERPTVDSIETLRDQFNASSDLFAELQLAGAATCAHWPEALDPLPAISTNQAPETLVIGGPTDAQTINAWSTQMAMAIGGRYLKSEHEGHTVVFSDRNQCTTDVASTFLLTGQLPTVSVCNADN